MSNEKDPTNVRAPGSGPRPRPAGEAAPHARYGEGDVIAEKYTLGRQLGQGGMGEVWFAHNSTLDIDVAIKLIRAGDETSDRADRLLNEARAAAKLGHPAIVRVNDFGKTDRGDPFIVMELLEGEDLAVALQRRGRLNPVKAARTILPIANALAVAHAKGIVHRDLKPENIFLAQNEDGQVQPKLVDFGVAKLEAGQAGRLTQTGELMGSPLYMSPEQARGDDVDHRSDVWGLGVVMYEMVTGHPPFEGKNYNAVLYSIIANPPTPITEQGVDDAGFWALIVKALAKEPGGRWPSMRDFGEAIAHWLEQRGINEDITGSSLQATWFSWVKDEEDQFASAPPPAWPSGAGQAAQGPDIPPPPALPRTREITIRKTRRRSMSPALLVGGGAAVLAVAIAVVMGTQSVSPVEGAASLATAAVRPSEPPPKAAEVNGVTVTDEAAGEMTGVFVNQPALDPSALPEAREEQAKAEVRAPFPAKSTRTAATRPPPPLKRTTTTTTAKPAERHMNSSGIVVKDPYASSQ